MDHSAALERRLWAAAASRVRAATGARAHSATPGVVVTRRKALLGIKRSIARPAIRVWGGGGSTRARAEPHRGPWPPPGRPLRLYRHTVLKLRARCSLPHPSRNNAQAPPATRLPPGLMRKAHAAARPALPSRTKPRLSPRHVTPQNAWPPAPHAPSMPPLLPAPRPLAPHHQEEYCDSSTLLPRLHAVGRLLSEEFESCGSEEEAVARRLVSSELDSLLEARGAQRRCRGPVCCGLLWSAVAWQHMQETCRRVRAMSLHHSVPVMAARAAHCCAHSVLGFQVPCRGAPCTRGPRGRPPWHPHQAYLAALPPCSCTRAAAPCSPSAAAAPCNPTGSLQPSGNGAAACSAAASSRRRAAATRRSLALQLGRSANGRSPRFRSSCSHRPRRRSTRRR